MSPDTLAALQAAHAQGYAHGVVIGLVIGALAGATGGMLVYALFIVGARADDTSVVHIDERGRRLVDASIRTAAPTRTMLVYPAARERPPPSG